MLANKIILFLFIFLLGFCNSNAQKLRNIKHFKPEVLNNIDTLNYYASIGVYFADKNYNIIKDLEDSSDRFLFFDKKGYIVSNGIASNKDGYSGVIYQKKGKTKIDLIGGTSDGSRIIRTYNVKLENNKIHLLEQSIFLDERAYYIYELRKK